MGTYDQMLVDNRYPGDFDDDDKYSFSKEQEPHIPTQDEDGNGSLGRRVYLESPSFDNKEEEDMYRYVPSRITDRTSSIIGPPIHTGTAVMDSLGYEFDIHGTNNNRSEISYQQESKPIPPRRQLSNTLINIPKSDPRQDPLLGPLLAELDAMSNQQQQLPPPPPIYRRNSVPYESNLLRPSHSSQPNHALTNIANRTVTDALLEAELYDSLNPTDQQYHQITSNINSTNYPQSRQQKMDGTDIFMPSSYSTDPQPFLSHFGPEDQLFQRPLLNTLGQNYVPNPRMAPPQQRIPTFDQIHTRFTPPQRTTYVPPHLPSVHHYEQPLPQRTTNIPPHLPSVHHYEQPLPQQNTNPFIEYQRNQPQEQIPRQPNNQDVFFTDHNDEHKHTPIISHRSHDQDSKRQTIWNELNRTSAKAQEKNAKKHEPPNRIRAAFGSNPNSQQSSPQRHLHHPPPISKPNYIEENADMIKNKENFYHRQPAKKYENSYSKRKDIHSGYENEKHEQNHQRQASLPVTFNLNSGENSQNGSLPSTVTVPLDSHINRVGDKISVNIDLRLADLQNMQHQQTSDHPQWSSLDPLDQHIRKLERNIDQSLPTTHPPQRSPRIPNTGVNPSAARYGKPPTGVGRGGYNPPVYGGDYYNYSDKGREEDSYLAKMNYSRKTPQFKPYTGRDYEQFKKNYGFGIGHLGYAFDNTNHKEKSENLSKTREYAQQIEARNKKKLSEMSRRTLSDTRLPTQIYKPRRPLEFVRTTTRPKQFSGTSTKSSPAILNEAVPFIPARRPTEVLYRPAPLPPKQLPKLPQHEDNEMNLHHERDKISVKSAVIPSPNRREQVFQNDNRRINSIERLAQNRTNQRRLSPPKQLPSVGENKRRPVRFDKPFLPDEPSPQQQTNVDQSVIRRNDTKMVLDVIQQELNERPLRENEELIVVEQ